LTFRWPNEVTKVARVICVGKEMPQMPEEDTAVCARVQRGRGRCQRVVCESCVHVKAVKAARIVRAVRAVRAVRVVKW